MNKIVAVLQTTSQNTFSSMKKVEFWMKCNWKLMLFDWLTMSIVNIAASSVLSDIAWTKVYQDPWRNITSLGHIERSRRIDTLLNNTIARDKKYIGLVSNYKMLHSSNLSQILKMSFCFSYHRNYAITLVKILQKIKRIYIENDKPVCVM